MKDFLVYTAGPIRSYNPDQEVAVEEVRRNLRRAREVAKELWVEGVSVICPHANTDLDRDIDMPPNGYQDEADWIGGDLVQIIRCDAILMLPGWENSSGAKEELCCAARAGLKIFFDVHALLAYISPLPDLTKETLMRGPEDDV